MQSPDIRRCKECVKGVEVRVLLRDNRVSTYLLALQQSLGLLTILLNLILAYGR